MSNHTPGPWSIAPHSDAAEVLEIVSDYSESGGIRSAHWIAECDLQEEEGGHDVDYATNLANARLIAAAPELLDALIKLTNESTGFLAMSDPGVHGHTNRAVLRERIRLAHDAIAKAEGQ